MAGISGLSARVYLRRALDSATKDPLRRLSEARTLPAVAACQRLRQSRFVEVLSKTQERARLFSRGAPHKRHLLNYQSREEDPEISGMVVSASVQ